MSFEAQLIKGVENNLTIEAYDNSSKIILANASAFDVSNILIDNVATIRGASIALDPTAGNVSISTKYLKQASGVDFITTGPNPESGLLTADGAGLYFADGANPSGSTKLARNLREAYGLTAEDANIAVSSYPVRLSDTAGTSNLLAINSQSGQNIFTVSNTAVASYRDISQNGNLTVAGDVRVTGNMAITGNITSINSTQLNVSDSSLYLNSGYTTTAGKSGGLAVNYLPTANAATISTATFVAGVANTSNPVISGLGGAQAWAVDGKIIQIAGSASNDGIYEIFSSNATAIVVRGVGTVPGANSANLLDVVANQFSAEVASNVDVREVNLSVLRVNSTNGVFQTARGSTSSALAYRNIGDVSFSGAAPVVTSIPVFTDVSGGNISASNVLVTGGNLTANAVTLLAPAANSTVMTTSGVAGPLFFDGKYAGQSTGATYTTIATLPINRGNSTVMLAAFVTGKRVGGTSSLSARIEAGAISAAAPGNALTLSSFPIKSLFRSAGTPVNYNVDVIVSGTNLVIRARGNTAELVDWQVDAKYSVGLFA